MADESVWRFDCSKLDSLYFLRKVRCQVAQLIRGLRGVEKVWKHCCAKHES